MSAASVLHSSSLRAINAVMLWPVRVSWQFGKRRCGVAPRVKTTIVFLKELIIFADFSL